MLIMSKKEDNAVDRKIVDNIRGLGIDMINEAKSGHPGIVLGASPIISTIFANHIKIDPKNDKWFNRDRFIMSAGHGSALLYATLYMAGYNISLDDLKNFRKLDSITPGHPEYGHTPGVDMTTGPLGQGLASSVGIAIGEKYLREYFGSKIVDYYTYVLCSDGDLMEGVSYEASSIAGKLGLNKLIVLYDSNDVTLDGSLNLSSNESIKGRFESQNWNYILVGDGENTNAISDAITKAKSSTKPTIIEVKTIIGRYSEDQGTSKVHGTPLQVEDILSIKRILDLWEMPFTISSDAVNLFQQCINSRNKDLIEEWNNNIEALDQIKKAELEVLINNKNPLKIKDIYYEVPDDKKDSTRQVSGKIITSIASNYPFFIGGSADLTSSTFAIIKDSNQFTIDNPSGKNVFFGIREHAMGAIANGLALTGITPFASTFFTFSDYMKPSIRLSAIMDLPVIYVFTHDSITVGEDGPTHEPIEQLVGLRSIPNLNVYRPSDANETIGAYIDIFERRKPAAIILGRNKVEIQELTSAKGVKNGAYIVTEETKGIDATLISSGEELEIAMEVHRILLERGIRVQIVSMPSQELFELMDKEYQEKTIDKRYPVFVLELSSSYSWYKYATSKDHMFTLDTFGASGNKKDVLNKYGFNAKEISDKIEKLIK